MGLRTSTFIVLTFLATNLRAQQSSLDLALRSVLTDINRIESFVTQASGCYEQADLEKYRDTFCREHKPYLYSFDSITSELHRDKEKNFEKWKGFINGAPAPAYAQPILKVINESFQACQVQEKQRLKDEEEWRKTYKESLETEENEESLEDNEYLYPTQVSSFWDEDLDEKEADEASPLMIDVFLPRDPNGHLSLNPEFFNQRLMSIETYGSLLSDPESKALIQKATKKASDIRAKLIANNPILLRYMFSQIPNLNPDSGVFWAQIQEKTGIDPSVVPAEVKADYEKIRHFRAVLNDLLDNKGYVLPGNNEDSQLNDLQEQFVKPELQRNAQGQLNIGFDRPDSRPEVKRVLTDEVFLSALGGTAEDYKNSFEINMRYSKPLSFSNPDMYEIMTIFERESAEIKELDQLERSIRDRYQHAIESSPDIDEDMGVPEDYVEEDFCESSRNAELREISDQDYLIGFYQNPENKKFMKDQFQSAQTTMNATIDRMNLSRGSKLGAKKLLSEVKFDYPEELTHEVHYRYFQDIDQGIALFQRMDPEMTRYEAKDRTQAYLSSEKQYHQFLNSSEYDGVNGTYLPNQAYQDGNHTVRIGCGLAHPTIQHKNPELFLGVMAHELGHALDPSLSITNREFYSMESRKHIEDLRACLIQNNQGQYSTVAEDFADHLESHFYATWNAQTKDDPEWPLRRLRFLHHAYSQICEEKEESFLNSHSNDQYRYAHVISHPELRNEYGEFALPSVPFCPQLISSDGGGRSR